MTSLPVLRPVLLLAVALGGLGHAEWGPDRLLYRGELGQYGIAADRTAGPDIAFVGLIASAAMGDTVKLCRTDDRGESWCLIWQAAIPGRTLTNLALRAGTGVENRIFLFWVEKDSVNNGDVAGVSVSFDGSSVRNLQPLAPGPDTITWLTVTRGFDSSYTVYVFWQNEIGLAGVRRAPAIRFSKSSDFGRTWSSPAEITTGFETPAVDHGAPGHLYLAVRSPLREDITAASSTDSGRTWTLQPLTADSTAYNDMFPCVASTHDSAGNDLVWVSYDSERGLNWDLRYAYSVNSGGLWVLDRELANDPGNHFFSSLECSGYGSRRLRAAYLSDSAGPFMAEYRVCEGINPAAWSDAITVSDIPVASAVPPVVASYGVGNDSLNQGLVFFAEPGPANLWYNAYQFAGVCEESRPLDKGSLVTDCLIDPGGKWVSVRFRLSEPASVVLELYAANGRRLTAFRTGRLGPGRHDQTLPLGSLAGGTYFLCLKTEKQAAAVKLVYIR